METRQNFEHWLDSNFRMSAQKLDIFQCSRYSMKGFGGLLFGSEPALFRPILDTHQIKELMDERTAFFNYKIFGHWGHGVNSYYIYYVWLHNNVRVFLRLPYGGVYQKTQQTKAKSSIPLIIKATEQFINNAILENASLSMYSLSGILTLRYYGDNFLELNLNDIYGQTDTLIQTLDRVEEDEK